MIYRIYPQKDTVITNYQRARVQQTASNAGASEILPLFKIAGISGSSGIPATASLSHVLMKFDLSTYSALTASNEIPRDGVSFRLVLRNARHAETLPYSYDIEVLPLTRDWDEGRGIDVEDFYDKGFANWDRAKSNVFWTTPGGDTTGSLGILSYHFDTGEEDVDLDITPFVNAWLTGTLTNNGLLVRLSSTLESNTEFNDYYVKKFFARNTYFPDERPHIEARWDDSLRDDRNNFVFDYTGSLFLYNKVRGQLTNLTGVGTGSNVLTVRIADLSGTIKTVSGSWVRAGVYSASFAIATSSYSGSRFSDIWFSGSTVFVTSSFTPSNNFSSAENTANDYFVLIPNMRDEYENTERVRFNLFVRTKDYSPAVVTTASSDARGLVVTKAYYRIDNDRTDEHVIPFGTGSVEWSRLSYDDNGNYFDLYMNALSPGEVYRIVFLFETDGYRRIIDEGFKFRVT